MGDDSGAFPTGDARATFAHLGHKAWNTPGAFRFRFQPTRASGFREVVGSIAASRSRLLITNYESLIGGTIHRCRPSAGARAREYTFRYVRTLRLSHRPVVRPRESDASIEEPVDFIYE